MDFLIPWVAIALMLIHCAKKYGTVTLEKEHTSFKQQDLDLKPKKAIRVVHFSHVPISMSIAMAIYFQKSMSMAIPIAIFLILHVNGNSNGNVFFISISMAIAMPMC